MSRFFATTWIDGSSVLFAVLESFCATCMPTAGLRPMAGVGSWRFRPKRRS